MSFRLEPGQPIGGRYRLERLLGVGGMGQVWAAQHLVTKRPCAVKFLKERGLDEEARRRLLKEARASCAVRHAGIVPVLDVLESDTGEPALVMDLLEGEPLARLLKRREKLSVEETVQVMLPVAEALGAAHEAGIVHRDLKPDNVFLTEGGDVKVLDFGIAKQIHVDADVASSVGTQTGAIVGTPMYMSPEQAFGERDIDARTDVWALGLMLYQCLTGTLPTAAENLGQVLKIVLTKSIPPLRTLAPEAPPRLERLVAAMLEREREERTASMAIVVEELSALAGPRRAIAVEPATSGVGASASATTTGFSQASTRHSVRSVWPRRWSVAAGAAAALALGLAAWSSLAPPRGEGAAPPRERAATTSEPVAASGSPSAPAPLATITPEPRASAATTATPSALASASSASARRVGAPASARPSASAAAPIVPPARSGLQQAVATSAPF